MIVLHPDAEQYASLNNYSHNSSKLLFVQDGSFRWIVGLEVLTHPNFAEIYDQLEQLERIEYTPFPDENN